LNAKNLKGRIATLALGHTVDQIMTKGFDFVIYPAVMYFFKPLWGTVVMILLSFILCLATMKFYDWSKTDWLGIETLKQIREDEKNGSWFSKLLSWALRKGNWMVLLILSIYKDAFITTVYMRKGANQYNGMNLSDWKIFIASLVISNIWWSFLVNLSMTSVKALFTSLFT
jgi:hypothetical protein